MRKTLAASPSQPDADGRLIDLAEFALDTGWDVIENNIDYFMTAMERAAETKTAVLNSFRIELFVGMEKRYREVISLFCHPFTANHPPRQPLSEAFALSAFHSHRPSNLAPDRRQQLAPVSAALSLL